MNFARFAEGIDLSVVDGRRCTRSAFVILWIQRLGIFKSPQRRTTDGVKAIQHVGVAMDIAHHISLAIGDADRGIAGAYLRLPNDIGLVGALGSPIGFRADAVRFGPASSASRQRSRGRPIGSIQRSNALQCFHLGFPLNLFAYIESHHPTVIRRKLSAEILCLLGGYPCRAGRQTPGHRWGSSQHIRPRHRRSPRRCFQRHAHCHRKPASDKARPVFGRLVRVLDT